MLVNTAKSADEALYVTARTIDLYGVPQKSRNGDVLRVDGPVTTILERPERRVLFDHLRDANPFFHLYESLWMLAGRNDLAPLVKYVKQMAEYSDDGGKTQNAAYGHRWRHARGVATDHDQLVVICEDLRANRSSRQEVLQIWDHARDLGTQTKDHACNLVATFQTSVDGKLDMVVFCRSNDVIWGLCGSNLVHFSMLLEYVARRSGLEMGTQTHVSVNYHAYCDKYLPLRERWHTEPRPTWDRYSTGGQFADVKAVPIADGLLDTTWDEDCQLIVTHDGRAPKVPAFKNDWFAAVPYPMILAHDAYKDGDPERALRCLEACVASDWRQACEEWIMRRMK